MYREERKAQMLDKRVLRPSYRRRGVVAVMVMMMLVVLMGFAALSVDVGHLYNVRSQLQNTADAAAHAAAAVLPDETAARNAAHQFAIANFDNCGTVLASADIQLGNWDATQGTFSAGGAPVNAIRVTTKQSKDTLNPVKLMFASILGIHNADLSASAIAMIEFPNNPDCCDRGIVAGKQLNMAQDIMLDGYCAFGREKIQLGQNAHVASGALIGVLDKANVQYGQGAVGLPENIVEIDRKPVLANNVAQIIDDLEAGINLPPQINNVVVLDDLPNTLQPGTAYVINASSTLNIDQDYQAQDVIIAVRGNISWGQNGAIRNTGDPNVNRGIGILATQDISLGQSAIVDGVSLVSGKSVTIGQNLASFNASIQAAENVIIAQNPQFGFDYKNAFAGVYTNTDGSDPTATRVLIVQ